MIIDNKALQCTVSFRHVNPVVLKFECVEWFGVDGSGNRDGYAGDGRPEAEFSDAERWCTGSVKWDGCSNWNFLPDDCTLHFCSGTELDRVSERMKWIYREASKLLERFEGELP